MKLTEEQIEENLKVYEHAMRTENAAEIEVANVSYSNWEPKISKGFYLDVQYRIRPTPKLRPYKQSEVPMKAVFRHKNHHTIYNLLWAGKSSVKISDATYLYQELLECYEHSSDNGKTWEPCGVMEE